MLKIKDNVDLKELEKFGFKRVEFRKIFHDYVRSYQWETDTTMQILEDEPILIQTDTIIIHDKDSVNTERSIQIIIEDFKEIKFAHNLYCC